MKWVMTHESNMIHEFINPKYGHSVCPFAFSYRVVHSSISPKPQKSLSIPFEKSSTIFACVKFAFVSVTMRPHIATFEKDFPLKWHASRMAFDGCERNEIVKWISHTHTLQTSPSVFTFDPITSRARDTKFCRGYYAIHIWIWIYFKRRVLIYNVCNHKISHRNIYVDLFFDSTHRTIKRPKAPTQNVLAQFSVCSRECVCVQSTSARYAYDNR